MNWMQSNLFESLPKQKFDLITANPPYIPSAEVLRLQATIRDFEPHLALDGGPDGLNFVRPIVEQATAWLSPGGALAVEIGYDQGPVVETLFREVGFSDALIHKDYGGRHRVVSGRFTAD